MNFHLSYKGYISSLPLSDPPLPSLSLPLFLPLLFLLLLPSFLPSPSFLPPPFLPPSFFSFLLEKIFLWGLDCPQTHSGPPVSAFQVMELQS